MPASRRSWRARAAISTMNPILRKTLPLLAIAAATGPQAAAAQTPCKAPSADCIAVGDLEVSLSVGVGTRTNPVVGRSDIPLFVVPHISYYGKRFFLESLEPGRDALRERREHLQPDCDAGLRPRVLQPPRSAERGRAVRGRGAAVLCPEGRSRRADIPGRAPPHHVPGGTGMAVPPSQFHRPGQRALRSDWPAPRATSCAPRCRRRWSRRNSPW